MGPVRKNPSFMEELDTGQLLELRNALLGKGKKAGHGSASSKNPSNMRRWRADVAKELNHIISLNCISLDQARRLKSRVNPQTLVVAGISNLLHQVLESSTSLQLANAQIKDCGISSTDSSISPSGPSQVFDFSLVDEAYGAGSLQNFVHTDGSSSDEDCALNTEVSSYAGLNLDISSKTELLQLSFIQILRHIKEKYSYSDSLMRELLGLLHDHQPQIDYSALPRTPESLLAKGPNKEHWGRVEHKDMSIQVHLRVSDARLACIARKRANQVYKRYNRMSRPDITASRSIDDDGAATTDEESYEADEEDTDNEGDSVHMRVVKKEYIHFGIHDGILGVSGGVLRLQQHLRLLRLVHAVKPHLISTKMLEVVDLRAYNKLSSEEIEAASNEPETEIWIDVNVDGVQFFENSQKNSGYPILFRIYKLARSSRDGKLDKLVVPLDLAEIVLGGLYFGEGKPPKEFIEPFIQEMERLHPFAPPAGRKCAVILRCMICDAVARTDLKGLGGHGAYSGCERCIQFGSRSAGAVRFLDLQAPQRKDDCWDNYLVLDKDGIPTQESHRRRDVPFNHFKYPPTSNHHYPMVFGFSLDAMHIFGRVVAHAFEAMLGLGGSKTKYHAHQASATTANKKRDTSGKRKCDRISEEEVSTMNAFMDAWAEKTPYEMSRHVRSFANMGQWKMREAYQVLIYHSVALFSKAEFVKAVGDDAAHAFMHLVAAMHLIGGHRHDAPSQMDIEKAKDCCSVYVSGFFEEFGPAFMISKEHCVIHLFQDAFVHQTHLGGVAAWPFENFQGYFRGDLVKSGKEVLKQVVNKLQRKALNVLPTQPNGSVRNFRVSEEAEKELLKSLASLILPALTVLHVRVPKNSNVRREVHCQGIRVTNEYPNNIVELSPTTTGLLDAEAKAGLRIVMAISDIHRDECDGGSLYLRGRLFQKLKSASHQHSPFPFKHISCYKASFGLQLEEKQCLFSAVIGKLFPFHMNLKLNCDPLARAENWSTDVPNHERQWWVLVRMKHTCPAQTFV